MAKVGRPSKFEPAFIEQVEKLCRLGAKEPELADFFGVNLDTIQNWKKAHPDFVGALKEGKEIADSKVAESLYNRALGFTKDEKYFPPDVTACIFWLKNRRPDLWRDAWKIEHSDKNGESLVNLSDESQVFELARRVAFLLNSGQTAH